MDLDVKTDKRKEGRTDGRTKFMAGKGNLFASSSLTCIVQIGFLGRCISICKQLTISIVINYFLEINNSWVCVSVWITNV